MTFPDLTPDLKAAMPKLRGRLLANQSLAELTWFRVGGPAQVLFTPVSPKARGDRRITTPGKPPSRTIRLEPTPTT